MNKLNVWEQQQKRLFIKNILLLKRKFFKSTTDYFLFRAMRDQKNMS